MHHSFITVVPRGRVLQCLVAIVLGLAIFFIAAPADAQSPAVRYERALAREKAARTMTGTSVATIRTIARSYEAIVHAYPRSGYADNALWQGAGMMQLAYERSGSVGDLQNARRMLSWLKREYPKATLAKQVDAQAGRPEGRIETCRAPRRRRGPRPPSDEAQRAARRAGFGSCRQPGGALQREPLREPDFQRRRARGRRTRGAGHRDGAVHRAARARAGCRAALA